MHRNEIVGLVAYMGELWPNYRQPQNAGDWDLRTQAWMDVLGDQDAGAVRVTVASMADREFAPSPGQIRSAMAQITNVALPDWDAFWEWVRQEAARASLYSYDRDPFGNKPEFRCKWPEMDGVVTLEDLVDGDVPVDEADLTNVRQAHIRRRYAARAERFQRDSVGTVPVLATWKRQALDAGAVGSANDGPARLGWALPER